MTCAGSPQKKTAGLPEARRKMQTACVCIHRETVVADRTTVELAKRAIKGNRKAFEELCVRKTQSMIYNAYAILGDLHEAEDAAQESMVIMYKSIGKLKSPEAIDIWMLRIVQNKSLRMLAKRKGRAEEIESDNDEAWAGIEGIEESDAEFLPERFAEDAELSARLHEIIMALPKKRRQAVFLYYYDDLSYKEIAEVMDASIKTVSANITRARQMIRAELERLERGDQRLASLGAVASTSVLGRVLQQQAVLAVPKESIVAVQGKFLAAVQTVPFNSAAATVGAVKSGSLVGGMAAGAMVGIMAAAGWFSPAAIEGELSPLDAAGVIVFVGEGVDGHVNPRSAELDDVRMEIVKVTWTVQSTSGSVQSAGEGTDLTAASDAIARLTKAGATGEYRLVLLIEDSDGNVVKKQRVFEIT